MTSAARVAHDRRAPHYVWQCNGDLHNWESAWLTQAFYTQASSWWDHAASIGPINPPWSVYQSLCLPPTTTPQVGPERTNTFSFATSSTSLPLPVSSSSSLPVSPAATHTPSAVSRTQQPLTPTMSLSSTPLSSSSLASASSSISSAPSSTSASLPPSATFNAHAGNWDWQAQGTVLAVGVAVVLGVATWGLWAVLRRRFKVFYAPRWWYLPPSARSQPPGATSMAALLTHFLHLPQLNIPLSEAQVMSHVGAAALGISALATVVGVGVLLPLSIAGVPHLSDTAPPNPRGGRLASLTDLSFLRLIDALHPASDSPAANALLSGATLHTRAFTSAVTPEIEGTRARLIAFLAITAVLWVAGTVLVVGRTYSKLSGYVKAFNRACDQQEMVFIPASKATAWRGLTETGIERRFPKGPNDEGSVAGVFAISDTSKLKELVRERVHVLNILETAEATYIARFPKIAKSMGHDTARLSSLPTRASLMRDSVFRDSFRRDSGRPGPSCRNSGPHDSALREDALSPSSQAPLNPHPSAERDVPTPVPEESETAVEDEAPVPQPGDAVPTSDGRSSNHSRSSSSPMPNTTPSDGSAGSNDESAAVTGANAGHADTAARPKTKSFSSTLSSLSALPIRPHSAAGASGSVFLEVNQRLSVVMRGSNLSIGDRVIQDTDGTFLPFPGSEGTNTPRDSGVPSQAVPSRPQSTRLTPELIQLKADITWTRARLLKLTAAIAAEQNKTMAALGAGENVVGWIIVGRGVRSLPFAENISGRSKEDVIWGNLARPRNYTAFWVKVALVSVVAAIFMTPFVGLAATSAPGFAHYLTFLQPLTQNNGIGAGAAEGLAPAMGIILLLIAGVLAVDRFARQANPVSWSERRLLALKGTFSLLLSAGTVCFIGLGAAAFAVDAIAVKADEARTVADGIVWIAWISFIVVVSLCVVVPGLLVMQPWRLVPWLLQRRRAVTPRQKFRVNLPPDFNPTLTTAPVLVGIFYASALGGVFPFVAAPCLVLAYLALISHAWLTANVYCVLRGGMTDGASALWTVRRLGWAACLQPLVLGLILLSRREWIIGGVSLGVALIALLAAEIVTVRLHPLPLASCFRGTELTGSAPSENGEEDAGVTITRFGSDHSILRTIHHLIPSLGRLPDNYPLPLPSDAIDDLMSTERAMYATPANAHTSDAFKADKGDALAVVGNADPARGLVYPPELLYSSVEVWLPHGEDGVAEREADALQLHGLQVTIDLAPAARSTGYM